MLTLVFALGLLCGLLVPLVADARDRHRRERARRLLAEGVKATMDRSAPLVPIRTPPPAPPKKR